jgi:hypothetical protein
MDIQFIIAIGILMASIVYLGIKYLKPLFANKNTDHSCGPNCKCE